MLAFALAALLLLITPGPGVMSLAGVGAAFGTRPGLAYMSGLCLGTNLVAGMVVAGYAALLLATPYIRTVLMALSFGYLFWLALKIAFAGRKLAFIQADRPPGLVGGVMLQIINPKAYVVNTALFTGFAFANSSLLAETAWKFLILNAIWIVIHLLWLYAGISLNRFNLSERAQFAINSGMALAMVGVVILAALVY
jgi:threonine/homoserine/homoserine lactone efflux protein